MKPGTHLAQPDDDPGTPCNRLPDHGEYLVVAPIVSVAPNERSGHQRYQPASSADATAFAVDEHQSVRAALGDIEHFSVSVKR